LEMFGSSFVRGWKDEMPPRVAWNRRFKNNYEFSS
jgi:hypothetical protein